MATSTAPQITTGTTFRYLIADANVLFKITHIDTRRGRVTAVGVNEPYDLGDGRIIDSEYAGDERDFLIEEVQSRVGRQAAMDAFFQSAKDADARFWESVNVGDSLHYDASFGQWVRGVVALDDQGNKGFKPIALVGESWRQHDLFTVDIDGTVHHGYHAKKVLAGEVWQPNIAEIYEAGHRLRGARADENPSHVFPERSLYPVAPSKAQEAEYAKGAQVKALREVLNDYTLTTDETLAKVRDLLFQADAQAILSEGE